MREMSRGKVMFHDRFWKKVSETGELTRERALYQSSSLGTGHMTDYYRSERFL